MGATMTPATDLFHCIPLTVSEPGFGLRASRGRTPDSDRPAMKSGPPAIRSLHSRLFSVGAVQYPPFG